MVESASQILSEIAREQDHPRLESIAQRLRSIELVSRELVRPSPELILALIREGREEGVQFDDIVRVLNERAECDARYATTTGAPWGHSAVKARFYRSR